MLIMYICTYEYTLYSWKMLCYLPTKIIIRSKRKYKLNLIIKDHGP